MTYLYSISLLTLAVFSFDIVPVAAHNGDRVIPIRYLSEETLALLDQDDGIVEDWVDAVGEPVLTPLDFNLWSGYDISYDQHDPANLDFRIWLGWSQDGRIHVAGQFVDDVYVNEYDPLVAPYWYPHVHDSMSLLVDGDHTGGEYFYRQTHGVVDEALKTNRQAQHYENIARAPGGLPINLLWTTLGADGFDEIDQPVDWMVQPPFARGGGGVFGENPAIWVTEFYVTCFDRLNHLSPEESIVSQFAEGKTIGFDLYIHDYDIEPVGPRALYWLAHHEDAEKDAVGADYMVDGLLLGPGGESGDTGVQSVSWGRIKASLGIDLRSEESSSEKD